MIEQLLDFVYPALQAYGDWEEISKLVDRIIQHGNGASRQRAIYQSTASLQTVVDFVVAQTEVGIDGKKKLSESQTSQYSCISIEIDRDKQGVPT